MTCRLRNKKLKKYKTRRRISYKLASNESVSLWSALSTLQKLRGNQNYFLWPPGVLHTHTLINIFDYMTGGSFFTLTQISFWCSCPWWGRRVRVCVLDEIIPLWWSSIQVILNALPGLNVYLMTSWLLRNSVCRRVCVFALSAISHRSQCLEWEELKGIQTFKKTHRRYQNAPCLILAITVVNVGHGGTFLTKNAI